MKPFPKKLIVLCLDGLGAPWLGPYGNTWYDTPSFNRLATESVTFEFPMAEGLTLDANYEAFWRRGPVEESKSSAAALDFWLQVSKSALITDVSDVVQQRSAERFGEIVRIETSEAPTSAKTVEETRLALTLAEAANWLSTPANSFLLWVHASALRGPWDAPQELRRLTVDEEAGDPDPPEFVAEPETTLASDYDPDELLGYMQAHSGQVLASDKALGDFLHLLDAFEHLHDSALVVTSARGYPLGERLAVGGHGGLYAESLHVPFFLRTPDRSGACLRSELTVQPSRLLPMAQRIASHGYDESVARLGLGAELLDADRVGFAQNDGATAVRTPGWFLSCPANGGDPQLFSKPDDRWEINDVADRCEDAVNELQALLVEYRECVDATRAFTPTLSSLLRDGYE